MDTALWSMKTTSVPPNGLGEKYVLRSGGTVVGALAPGAWPRIPEPYVACIEETSSDQLSAEFALYADEALEWAEASLHVMETWPES